MSFSLKFQKLLIGIVLLNRVRESEKLFIGIIIFWVSNMLSNSLLVFNITVDNARLSNRYLLT